MADGGFHSGEALAQSVGVSRAGVWKHLDALAHAGLGLERVRGRGYRLRHPVEPLETGRIRAALDPAWRERIALHLLDTVPSTNQWLSDHPERVFPGPAACIAEGQVAGRGRRGRAWQSAYAGGIPLSLAWRLSVLNAGIMGLAPAVAVSIAASLERLGASPAGLKWPNDVVCDQGKLAGVLIELRGDPAGPCDLVLGVGLNWAAPQGPLDQAVTDLAALFPAGRPSRNETVGSVIAGLCRDLECFVSEGFAPFRAAWAARDVLAGESVTLDMGARQLHGRAEGVDEVGALRVREPDGRERAWQVGEVSVRRGAARLDEVES